MKYGWTRFLVIAALLLAGLAAAAQAEVALQETGEATAEIRTAEELRRVVGRSDGTARFEFAARPGVWGNGRTWNFTRERGEANDGGDWRRRCEGCTNGPVRVLLHVERGVVTRVDSQVGGRWRESGRDVGTVAPAAAADYLLALVERDEPEPDADSREEALQAAVSARGVEIWPRVLAVAQDRSQANDVREAALFWTAHEAGVRAAGAIEDIALASDEETDVQEAAVFALTQLPDERGTDALLRLARENRNPDIVQTVYFWLGQSEDPRVIALFEEVLLD